MRKKLLTTVALAATISASNAFIVTVESGFTAAITDNAGNVIGDGGGVVVTGSFLGAVPDFANSTGQQVDDAFTQFGDAGAIGFQGFAGLYEVLVNTGGRIATGEPLDGATIFTLIGNAATIAESTELLAVQHTTMFEQDSNEANDKSARATLSDGTLLHGGDPRPAVDVGGGNLIGGVSLAPLVPEPSSSLLFGVAGLALLIRRKR